jgi:hypothetical protein
VATAHKYAVGDRVAFSTAQRVKVVGGGYEVLALLPSEGGSLLYRLKSGLERYERIGAEDELTRWGFTNSITP